MAPPSPSPDREQPISTPPTSPPAASPPPSTSKGSGCFGKGCLFGCVVPFVVTVVLFAIAGQLMGPLLQQLRGKSVWAEYAARVVDFAGTMSKDDSEPTEADAGGKPPGDSAASTRAPRRPGDNDPSALPKDLPVHPAPIEALYNIGPTHILVYQRVAGSRDAAISRLREMMGRQGWKTASETPGEWSTIVRWTKGDRSCMVEFADDSTATEIWLRSMASRNKAASR